MMRDKGRPGWPFQLLLVVCWLVGEIGGGVAGLILSGSDELNVMAIGGALVGVAIAATVVFLIANAMPPLQHPMMMMPQYGAYPQQYGAYPQQYGAYPGMPPGPPGPPAPPI
jgi:hypothetical protein